MGSRRDDTNLTPIADAGWTVLGFLRDRLHWARNTNTATWLLHRVRPSRVSEPIVASCDEVALFDVITEAGGKMPGGETTPQDPAA